MSDDIKLVDVFAGEYWKAEMIKQLLEDNNIPAFLNNQYLGTVAPYLADLGGMPNIKVMVNQNFQQQAWKLIDEFNNSRPMDEMAD
jgi:hypothetical protein